MHGSLHVAATCSMLLTIALGMVACSQTDQKPILSSPQNNSSQVESATMEQPTELTIVMIPSQSSDAEAKQRQLLADYLQTQLGMPINIKISQDYDTAIDLLVNEKVQMAYLGPFSYVKAHQRNPLLEPVVAPIDKRTGRPWYTSVIIANASQGINSLADLQGKHFGFVSESSTSGYLVPLAHLQESGIDPENNFSTVVYVGSHNKNLEELIAGKVDAISINKPTYLKAQQAGNLPSDQYKLPWESDPIPNAPIVIPSQLPSQFKIELQKALINAPAGLVALSGAKSDGYTLVEDKEYDVIRQLQATLGTEVTD